MSSRFLPRLGAEGLANPPPPIAEDDPDGFTNPPPPMAGFTPDGFANPPPPLSNASLKTFLKHNFSYSDVLYFYSHLERKNWLEDFIQI